MKQTKITTPFPDFIKWRDSYIRDCVACKMPMAEEVVAQHLISRHGYSLVLGVDPGVTRRPGFTEEQLNRFAKILTDSYLEIGGPYDWDTIQIATVSVELDKILNVICEGTDLRRLVHQASLATPTRLGMAHHEGHKEVVAWFRDRAEAFKVTRPEMSAEYHGYADRLRRAFGVEESPTT
jgi:hypothetical protein